MNKKKSHCNSCGKETNHAVLFTEDRSGSDDEMSWTNEHMLLSCLGCDHVSYREESSNSEDWDPETEEDQVYVTVYPKNKESRARPAWFEDVYSFDTTLNLVQMLKQIYEAYDNSAHWLCIMGVRAVIENIMISKIGDQRSFGANLSAFARQGFITDAHRLALMAAIDQGSAAIHKGDLTKQKTALAAIQVLENVVESIFVVPLHEAKLKK